MDITLMHHTPLDILLFLLLEHVGRVLKIVMVEEIEIES